MLDLDCSLITLFHKFKSKFLVGYRMKKLKKSVDEIFQSKDRVKILRALRGGDELGTTEIMRRARIELGEVATKHLNHLLDLGIIMKKSFGRNKIYYRVPRGLSNPEMNAVWERSWKLDNKEPIDPLYF